MKKPDRVILALLALSLIANVALTLLLRHERTARIAGEQRDFDSRVLPEVGAPLSDLHLLNLKGNPTELEIGPRQLPVIAYVLSPTCRWCELNRRSIDSLASQLQGRYRIIGISTTANGLLAYQNRTGVKFPLYSVDPGSLHADFSLAVTPETLVFSPDGRFTRGWSGAYIGDTRKSVSAFFGATLPE